ncbi:hypothetical protein DH2020_049215 [Rehmannia glutinosa]|uniref:Late embryogenesis abundant protein LEA-2 subgroup domain-containing protein n=1 Tax=Rehmannia glutinosa TaxID=99300 RepID=A0ABR0U3H9_REHGL
MSDKKEQVKPLAPAAHRLDIEDQTDAFPPEYMAAHHRRCIKCGGCIFAILLIIVMVLLVLMFTVFRVKDPILKINYVNTQDLDNRTDFGPGHNLTIEAHVSVRNPNVASFRFSNVTTDVYYDGSIIGEAWAPSGEVRARRTLRMNLPIELRADNLGVGILAISSYTRISGKPGDSRSEL